MNIFEYFEDHSIRCLVGRFTKNTYNQLIKSRRENLGNWIIQYLNNKLETSDIGTIGFQRSLTLNQRSEPWRYPIFCFNLHKSNHTTPFFLVTKGWNKVYTNFLARRPVNDIPVLVVNYGRISTDIIVERDIYTESELEDFVGVPAIKMQHSYVDVDNSRYLSIDHIRDDKVNLGEIESTQAWLTYIKSLMIDSTIEISIIDKFNSEITNTNNIFKIVDMSDYGIKVPDVVERTTHIREYKNLLKNDNKEILNFVLITNRKIKLDLFDIIWFLQDHASDYVSEDRSYSILGPGVFCADSVLPGSEL
jgi:hypothetical protein